MATVFEGKNCVLYSSYLGELQAMNRMFYFRGELAQISLLDKLYLNILQQKILWVSLAIVCQKMKKNIDQ